MGRMLMEKSIEWVLEEEEKANVASRKWGITLLELSKHLGSGVTVDDLHEVNEDVARTVLAEKWRVEELELLPVGIDYLVFDSSIVCGTETARRWLRGAFDQFCAARDAQGSGGSLEGIRRIGSIGGWLSQLDQASLFAIVELFIYSRRRRHRTEPDWYSYFQQKTNRVNRVRLRTKQTLTVSVE